MTTDETPHTPSDDCNDWWPTLSQDPLVLTALRGLVGDRMYAVTFILDYIQLQFDDNSLNAWTNLSVVKKDTTLALGDVEFRNELCSPIGRNVVDCQLTPNYLSIVFDDCELRLSLTAADYVGPEAGELRSPTGLLVFRLDRIFVFPNTQRP